jgi:hypothetical protein
MRATLLEDTKSLLRELRISTSGLSYLVFGSGEPPAFLPAQPITKLPDYPINKFKRLSPLRAKFSQERSSLGQDDVGAGAVDAFGERERRAS